MKIVDFMLCNDAGERIPFRTSPNIGADLKLENLRYLIVHFTAGASAASSINWLVNPDAKASAHLVIGRDGSITQLVPFNKTAWHAGKSLWTEKNGTVLNGLNAYSIGVELDNPGPLSLVDGKWQSAFKKPYNNKEVIVAAHKGEKIKRGWLPYTTLQIEAAQAAATAIVREYHLKDALGHDDIAPGRKLDPGPLFPMDEFRKAVLGSIG